MILQNRFGLFAIGFTLLFLAAGVFLWTESDALLPYHYEDAAYHLATAEGFVRAGGPVTWRFWESLPLGRPNNYPPLFHLIIALFLEAGIAPMLAGKLAFLTGILGGGAAFAWALTKLFGAKVAFLSTLLLFLVWDFFFVSMLTVPATLVVFLAPAAFYALVREKWVALAGLLAVMFYTHMLLPYAVILALFVWCVLCNRGGLKRFLLAAGAGLVLFLPWFWPFVTKGISFIKYWYPSLTPHASSADINVIVLVFLTVGILALPWKRWREFGERDKYFLFFVILWLLLLPVSAFASARGLNGHALAASAPLVAAGFLLLSEKGKTLRYLSWAMGVLLAFGVFYVNVAFPILKAPLFLSAGVITKISTPARFLSDVRTGEPKAEWEREAAVASGMDDNVAGMIDKNSGAGESIAALFGRFHGRGIAPEYQNYPAFYFGGMSWRPVINAGRPEILFYPPQPFDRARVLLTDAPLDEWAGLDSYILSSMLTSVQEKFSLVGQTSSGRNAIYVYRSQSDEALREVPVKPVVPLYAAFLFFLALGSIIAIDMRVRLSE